MIDIEFLQELKDVIRDIATRENPPAYILQRYIDIVELINNSLEITIEEKYEAALWMIKSISHKVGEDLTIQDIKKSVEELARERRYTQAIKEGKR